jgi:uncharacterized protein
MELIHKFRQGNDFYVIDVNSGAVHEVDELVYDMLDSDKLQAKEALKKIYKDRYSSEEIDEVYEELQSLVHEEILYSKDLYENIAMMSGQAEVAIKALCLNIIHDCNLKCKYCFADEGEYNGCRKTMSAQTGKDAIDFVIKNSGKRKNIEVDLFGGEPLMAFDIIKEIVDYGREQEKNHNKNIRFTMTTNSTLLNDEIMDYLDKNMGNIILSIDGRKEVNDKVRIRFDGSGTYESILPKIKKMVDIRDKSKTYYVRGTFTSENTDFFEDVKHMVELGFDEVSIEPVVLPDEHELALSEEDLPTIFAQYDKLYEYMIEKYEAGKPFKFYHFNVDLQGGPCIYKRISGCGAGHEYVAVTPDGEIYPCHQFVGNKDFLMGDIYKGIKDFSIVQNLKDAHIYNKPTCKNCWARFYCSGGCQANNFNFNGDVHVPYELGCKMQKKRIECAIALKAKTMNK